MSDYINDLIDEAIDQLSDDNINSGVDSLVELAQAWAKAGLPMYSFLDMRKYIIDSAKERVGCSVFIDLKVKAGEEAARKIRDQGHSITSIITH